MSVNPFASYVVAKVGNIPQAKLERALNGLAVRLTNANLSGDRVMLVHPENKRLIEKAKKAKKGLTTHFTPFEAMADLHYHENAGAGLAGGSLWSWLKNKAWPWLKQNWGVIKPVVSKLADVAVPAVATAFGHPEAAIPVRSGIKTLTGVGVKKKLVKGSEEAKEYMRALRARRTNKKSKSKNSDYEMEGSSFRMP